MSNVPIIQEIGRRLSFVTRIALSWLVASAVCLAAQVVELEPFQGVRHFHGTTTAPRLLDYHIVEIDMTVQGIGSFVTPSNGAASGETNAQTTKSFLTQYGAQIAINGSFFSSAAGGGLNISGLSASQGDVYSTFEAGRVDALNITQSNIASIIRGSGTGTNHTPATTIYNAINGSEKIVSAGVNSAGSSALSTELHPRTAAGVTASGKLLLFVVDGRNNGHSLGMSLSEVANLLIQYGAYNAINLDGGGSSTMVFRDPTPRLVNVPVGSGSPDTERAVGNNLGIFAAAKTGLAQDRIYYANFEGGDEGNFGYAPNYSGSTQGILATSTANASTNTDHTGLWSQWVVIRDDPATSSTSENPNGWFVRHISGNPGAGTPAARSSNTIRPTQGEVGFWAMTTATGIEVAMAIDDAANVTADRGFKKLLIADGQWHRYAWNLDDNDQWEGWINGTGTINTASFTLDSIQFFGQNSDVSIYIDDVFHQTIAEPLGLAGDYNGNGVVDAADYVVWRNSVGSTTNLAADGWDDNRIDQKDYQVWRTNFGKQSASGANLVNVPEPSTALLIAGLWPAAALLFRRQSMIGR